MQPADTVDTISSYKLLLDELPSSSLSKEVQNPAVFENSNVRARTLSGAAWSFSSSKVAALNAKMDKTGSKLGEVMVIGQGMQTGLNGVFGNRTNKDIKQLKLKQEHYRLRASNSQILRYQILPAESYIIFIEDIAAFKRLSEQAQEYFLSHRKELSERAAFRRGDCEWWKFTWPLHYELYGGPKLLCPYMAKENRFAIDKDDKYLGLTDTTVLFPKSTNILYLLGLLNSKALTFRFKTIGKLKSGGVLEYFWNSISKLPIRILDLTKPAEKAQHDRMVQLVEAMLSTQQQFAAAGSDADLTFYQSKADSFDWQIDELTFDLYGFTAEERTLVRGA